MAFKSGLKQVGVRQNSKSEIIAFRVDDSDVGASYSTDGLDEGSNYATIKTSATGTYQIQLNRACRRIPVIIGAIGTGEVFVRIATPPTAAGFIEVRVEDDAGSDIDADFHLTLLCFYAEKER